MEAKRVVQLVDQPSVEHTDACPDSFHGDGADLLACGFESRGRPVVAAGSST